MPLLEIVENSVENVQNPYGCWKEGCKKFVTNNKLCVISS